MSSVNRSESFVDSTFEVDSRESFDDLSSSTDDLSSFISNDRDTQEEAHGNGWGRTEDGTEKKSESSICTGFQNSLRHFGNYVRYVTTSLLRVPEIFKTHSKESAKKDESDKKETEYHQHLETTPVVNDFDDIPDVVLLKIFKGIGTGDRLRLERVNRRWQRLLMESWKDVRVLDVWDIYSPSLTDDDIEFLRNRVTPLVKSLDFGRFHWKRPEDKDAEDSEDKDEEDSEDKDEEDSEDKDGEDSEDKDGEDSEDEDEEGSEDKDAEDKDAEDKDAEDKDAEDKLGIARKIFSSLSSPPCALEEVVLWNGMLDQSTVSSLRQIGHQITSIAVRIIPILNIKPEPENGSNFFEPLPNLKRLECTFPGVYSLEDDVSCQWDTLPSSLEYLHLLCWGVSLMEDDLLKKFFQLEKSLCSLRELHLTKVLWNKVDETMLSGLVLRFPNLEVLEMEAHLVGLELISPLKKLRELRLAGRNVDIGFLSHALSFEFRQHLEIFHVHHSIHAREGRFLPQNHLENLSCFPNLKVACLSGREVIMNVDGLEKIAKGCKKLQNISFDPYRWLNDDGLRILGENCPDLRFLNLPAHYTEVTEEGIDALFNGMYNPDNLRVSLCDCDCTDSETSESESGENCGCYLC